MKLRQFSSDMFAARIFEGAGSFLKGLDILAFHSIASLKVHILAFSLSRNFYFLNARMRISSKHLKTKKKIYVYWILDLVRIQTSGTPWLVTFCDNFFVSNVFFCFNYSHEQICCNYHLSKPPNTTLSWSSTKCKFWYKVK